MKFQSFVFAAILATSMAVPLTAQDSPCRWWQLHCSNDQVDGLPDDAPRTGTVITVDISTNTLYLFQDGQQVVKTPVATGKGTILKKGNKVWAFHTPRGHMKVLRKLVDPVWRKPDWAFIEDGDPVPAPDSPKRYVKGHLGKYALDLGDGILIHGTDDVDSIGHKVSHGCVRLPDDALEKVYNSAKVGTDVYIFESAPVQESTTEIHSDLDIGRRK